MLATRDFWFEEPVASNSEWDSILDLYETTQEWPDIELPNKQMLLDTLLHTRRILRLDPMDFHMLLGGSYLKSRLMPC